MNTTAVVAVALDGPVDLEQLSPGLGWPELRRYPYGLALQDPDGGLVHVFTFGAAVFLGRERVPPALLQSLEVHSGRRALEGTADCWTLEIGADTRGPRVRVGWDRIRLPSLQPELVASTALLLGQSAALERYERRSDELVAEARQLAEDLRRRGRPPAHTRDLVRQVGRVNSDRLAIAAELYILDRPEETWEDPVVAALHDELLAGLELLPRHESLLRKLEAVEGATSLVIELWHGRAAHLLEWAIVLLIVFEILITLVEHALSA